MGKNAQLITGYSPAAGNLGSIGDNTRNELVSVDATSKIVADVNPRICYSIVNSSLGGQYITINLGFSQAIVNEGIVLSPGQSWVESNAENYLCYQGSITAISSAAGGQISIFER